MEPYMMIELEKQSLLECFDFWDFENDRNKIVRLIIEMESGMRKMFAVKSNDSFIAGCSLSYHTADNLRSLPNKRAYISYLAVKEEYRGQGIGTFMMNFLFDIAYRNGLSELSIMVDNSNISAAKLYKKLGFTSIVLKTDEQMLLLKVL